MSEIVVSGAMLVCTMGMTPGKSALTVEPASFVSAGDMPVASIMDYKPGTNIKPFGLCKSLGNPATATQTAAALGTLTPGTCAPIVPAPWAPGSATVMVGNKPALTANSKCACTAGGMISIDKPGQTDVTTG